MSRKAVTADVPNAYHIAICSDELVIKVIANRRTLDGTMHQGAYKAIYPRAMADVWSVLLSTLRRLQKSKVDHVFIYTNDPDLDSGIRPGVIKTKRDKLAQVKSAVMVALFEYAQRGGWYYARVKPEQIPSTRDLKNEANQ